MRYSPPAKLTADIFSLVREYTPPGRWISSAWTVHVRSRDRLTEIVTTDIVIMLGRIDLLLIPFPASEKRRVIIY
jgi:hypothetical protein